MPDNLRHAQYSREGVQVDDPAGIYPPASQNVLTGGLTGKQGASRTVRTVNVHDFELLEPLKQLDLPSPYFLSGVATTKEHAYGTPIYFPLGWNGYKYWMVAAPYPTQGGTSLPAYKYENPTIYVSNDGENFFTPLGIQSNPIFSSIGIADSTSYYADPYIVAAPDNSRLYVLWCWFNKTGVNKSSFLLTESTDGLNWTTPVEILPSTSTTFQPNSPSLIWNGNGWTIMAIDTRDGTGTFTVITTRTNGTSPYTGWTAPGAVFNGVWTQCTAPNPLGRGWWHAYWVGCSENQIIGFASDNSAAGGTAYSMQSSDGGLTFSVQPFSAWGSSAGGTWYRPGICVMNDDANISYRMYNSRIAPAQAGSAGGFYMQTARIAEVRTLQSISRAVLRDLVNRQVAGGVLNLLAYDSFNRADSTTTLGNADSGQTWAYNAANVFGISTNRAYNTSAANAIAVVDALSYNYDVEVTIQTVGTAYFLIPAYVDSSNFLRVGLNSNIQFQRIVGGGVVASATAVLGVTIANGDRLRVNRQGNKYTFYLNDRVIDSVTDSTYPTATKVGIQASGASQTYFENFILRNG